MNNNHMDEIEKEDKKGSKSFGIITLLFLIAGGCFGANPGNLKQIFGENVSSLLISILEKITPFASLILSMLVIIVSKIIYTNSLKRYDLWKQSNEDDNSIDKIEENLSYLILLTSVNQILGFFFFGIGIILLFFVNINGEFSSIKALCLLMGFILCNISSIVIQNKIIAKEINPLLKGSIYDTNFDKKWLDSCDESIKLGIFKSAYKAYTSVSKTCTILWVFCIVGYGLLDFGIMPIIIVTIIWLVQTISYCMESIKYSKTK